MAARYRRVADRRLPVPAGEARRAFRLRASPQGNCRRRASNGGQPRWGICTSSSAGLSTEAVRRDLVLPLTRCVQSTARAGGSTTSPPGSRPAGSVCCERPEVFPGTSGLTVLFFAPRVPPPNADPAERHTACKDFGSKQESGPRRQPEACGSIARIEGHQVRARIPPRKKCCGSNGTGRGDYGDRRAPHRSGSALPLGACRDQPPTPAATALAHRRTPGGRRDKRQTNPCRFRLPPVPSHPAS